MSDRCEPPEHLRGVDGWHWVQIADWPATVNRWVWDAHEGIVGDKTTLEAARAALGDTA